MNVLVDPLAFHLTLNHDVNSMRACAKEDNEGECRHSPYDSVFSQAKGWAPNYVYHDPTSRNFYRPNPGNHATSHSQGARALRETTGTNPSRNRGSQITAITNPCNNAPPCPTGVRASRCMGVSDTRRIVSPCSWQVPRGHGVWWVLRP
jgi:hypothetical protein